MPLARKAEYLEFADDLSDNPYKAIRQAEKILFNDQAPLSEKLRIGSLILADEINLRTKKVPRFVTALGLVAAIAFFLTDTPLGYTQPIYNGLRVEACPTPTQGLQNIDRWVNQYINTNFEQQSFASGTPVGRFP